MFDRTTFSNQYMPPDMRDTYNNYMEQNDFPATIGHKDLANLGAQLRRRNFVFGSDIRASHGGLSYASNCAGLWSRSRKTKWSAR